MVARPARAHTRIGCFSREPIRAGRLSSAPININDKPDLTGNGDTLAKNPGMGNLFIGALAKIALPAAVSNSSNSLTLYFDNNSMKDLWMSLTWGT